MTQPSNHQENISAGRDFVGQNQYNTVQNYFGNTSDSTLDMLYRELDEEKDSQLKEFIDDLRHLANQVDRKIIGLEAKLSDADLSEIIDDALEYKEKFEKILYRCQYSLAAQKIFLHFLSKARAIFRMEVKLAFSEIDAKSKPALVRKQIVDVLQAELGVNRLGISFDEVWGMVFFLTGNCHINWK